MKIIKNIRDLKLRTKIFMGFASMMLVLIIVLALFLFLVIKQNNMISEIYNVKMNSIKLTGDIKEVLSQIRVNEISAIADAAVNNTQAVEVIQTNMFWMIEDINTRIKKFENQYGGKAYKEYLDEFNLGFVDYQQLMLATFDSSLLGNVNDAANNAIYISGDAYSKSSKALDEMVKKSLLSTKEYYDSSSRLSYFIMIIIVAISIFSLLLGIFFSLFISNLITKPINTLLPIAKKIENGEIITEELADIHDDEIGMLQSAFNRIIITYKNISHIAEQIASGNLQTDAENFSVVGDLGKAFTRMTQNLIEIIGKVKEITVNLNSSTKEIHAGAEEQTSAATEQASGITEVSATLEELLITAKQITKNTGELVYASGESIKLLENGEKELLQTVSQLNEVGNISKSNAEQIGELGKRSILINEMVEIIKDVANKTNMLSINASIEASRAGEIGKGFSVVAAEIRELSKETITSAKNVEKAAKEIQDFISTIIISSESESDKVLESGKTVKRIHDDVENLVEKINTNYTFTQKIDISIKQQENGSKQAAETMKQMSEIAKQSAEGARQTVDVVKSIVELSDELNNTVRNFELNKNDDASKKNEKGM